MPHKVKAKGQRSKRRRSNFNKLKIKILNLSWRNLSPGSKMIQNTFPDSTNLNISRGVFRTQSKIYDRAFLWNKLTDSSRYLFLQEKLHLRFSTGYKYISEKYHVKDISAYVNLCCTSCIIGLLIIRSIFAIINLLERNQLIRTCKIYHPKSNKTSVKLQINYTNVSFHHSAVGVSHILIKFYSRFFATSLLTFTCSKSALKHYKKVWNMLKVNSKNIRITSLMSFWCFYC